MCTHKLLRLVSSDKVKLIHSRAEGKRRVREKLSLTESSINPEKIIHIKSQGKIENNLARSKIDPDLLYR